MNEDEKKRAMADPYVCPFCGGLTDRDNVDYDDNERQEWFSCPKCGRAYKVTCQIIYRPLDVEEIL